MKVLFLPNNNVNAKICPHRWGAKATVSQNTDLYLPPSAYVGELLGFEHNIAPTFFLLSLTVSNLIEVVNSERCGFGIYFSTAYWFNGTSVVGIPDYSATTWTSAGVNAFANAVLGEAKITRYPNHGQQMFDISGGVYGYDTATASAGSNNLNEVAGLAQKLTDNFKLNTGKIPSVISYQNGEIGIAPFLIDYFLAGRNSDRTAPYDGIDGRTAYGFDKNTSTYLGTPDNPFSKADRISQPSTTRYWDTGKDLVFTQDQIERTILNKGWYNDFIHYHSAYNAGTFQSVDDFFAKINETIGADFVWRAGYDEAMEYMFLREGIEIIIGNEKDQKVTVFLQVTEVLESLYDKIQTPISVEVDLTGTYLAGKNIKCGQGKIKSIGSNVYIIDTHLKNLTNGIYSFVLEEETGAPTYQNFSLPQVLTDEIVGNNLTITTDIPTKAVLFSGEKYDCEITERSNVFQTEHTFDVTGLTQVRIGVISEMKQSILIDII